MPVVTGPQVTVQVLDCCLCQILQQELRDVEPGQPGDEVRRHVPQHVSQLLDELLVWREVAVPAGHVFRKDPLVQPEGERTC